MRALSKFAVQYVTLGHNSKENKLLLQLLIRGIIMLSFIIVNVLFYQNKTHRWPSERMSSLSRQMFGYNSRRLYIVSIRFRGHTCLSNIEPELL